MTKKEFIQEELVFLEMMESYLHSEKESEEIFAILQYLLEERIEELS